MVTLGKFTGNNSGSCRVAVVVHVGSPPAEKRVPTCRGYGPDCLRISLQAASVHLVMAPDAANAQLSVAGAEPTTRAARARSYGTRIEHETPGHYTQYTLY